MVGDETSVLYEVDLIIIFELEAPGLEILVV
jgi:hypothetical protein